MNDQATTIGAEMYQAQEPKALSETYMRCIAREGLSGLTGKEKTQAEIAKVAYVPISKYFTGWSDSMNRDLSEEFAKAYLKNENNK